MNTEISTGSDLNSMAFAEHVAGGAAGGVTYVVKGGRDLRAEIGSPTGIASGADVEALKAGQSTSTIYKATLAELEAVSGAFDGQGGFVPGLGQYSWNGTQWIKISDDLLSEKADRSELEPIRLEIPGKADRDPLVERLYVADAFMVPLLGITNKHGDIQIPLQYRPDAGELLNLGKPLLTASRAADYVPGLSIAAATTQIPILGVTAPDGQVQSVVHFDVVSQSLLVAGELLGKGQNPLPRAEAVAVVEGTTVHVHGQILKPSGRAPIDSSVEISPPGAIDVVGQPYSLVTSAEPRWYVNPNAPLPYRFIVDVSVSLEGEPLVEGVDYSVWYIGGKIRGVSGTGTRDVSISYQGLPQRYDLIVADPVSGEISLIQGVARSIDPQEYRPAAPAGKIALFSVFSYGDTVRVVPVANWNGTNKRGMDLSALKDHNMKTLAPIRAALLQGRDITLIGYGDSITALGGNATATAPNGPARDTKAFFIQMPADTYAAIPALDFGDGAGPVHTDLGWNRQLKAFIERTYGVDVEYLNFGIGGTNSGTGDAAGRPNALNPDRLQHVVAAVEASAKPVLVNLAYGMNELGSAATMANMAELVRTFREAGAVVQILGVPRPNSYGGFGSLPAWRYTNDVLHAVALTAGAALSPTAPYFDENDLGYMGIFAESFAAAGSVNHAGPGELKALAQPIIRNFEV